MIYFPYSNLSQVNIQTHPKAVFIWKKNKSEMAESGN